MDIEERVVKVIREKLGKKVGDINLSDNFVENLGADSLDTVELVMGLEEEFNIEIPDEDAAKIKTVQEAVGYIKSKAA